MTYTFYTKTFFVKRFGWFIIIKENEKFMAKSSDYFGLGYLVSLILAIIPVTAWILGALTRFSEGKIVAGIIRLVFGFTLVWVVDLVMMILSKHIWRLLNI